MLILFEFGFFFLISSLISFIFFFFLQSFRKCKDGEDGKDGNFVNLPLCPSSEFCKASQKKKKGEDGEDGNSVHSNFLFFPFSIFSTIFKKDRTNSNIKNKSTLLLLIKKFRKRIQIKRLLLWKCLKMKRRIQRQLVRKHYKHLYYPSKRHLYGRRKKADAVAITEKTLGKLGERSGPHK